LNQSNTQTAPQNQWSAPTGAPIQNNYPAPGRRMDSAPTQQVKRKGYVITVGVPKGGVGKSSLTLNLAAFLGLKLRKLNRTVCVIDANFQQADSGKYIDTYTPNITEIARDPNILSRDRINEILVPVPRYNMSVLLGPDNPDDADPSWLRAHLFVKILDLLKEKFDYILIDTPVAEKYHEIFKDFALPQADYIIVPVAPNFPTLYNADNWLKSSVVAPTSAGGANVDRHKIGILLNMAQEGIDCSVDDVRQTLHEWSFIGAIPYSKEWIKASNSFELIAGKNFHDLHAVLAEVLNHATGEPALLEGYESFEEEKKSFFGRFRKKK
jgi:pilus assembly protein CpaE